MMIRYFSVTLGLILLACFAGKRTQAAIAIDQITDINTTGLTFDGPNVFGNPPIGVDETGVFMNNDIVVYSLIGGGNANGGGLSISISNGENGITQTNPPPHPGEPPGTPNFDPDNTEPPHPVFAAIGNPSGKLENGNAIRFSMWMRQDPNSPVVKEPSVEPVVKIELWKQALSGYADFNSALFPGGGDRIWDTDQNAGHFLHEEFGQSQADWVDMNNDGDISNGSKPVAVSLVTNEWRLVETTLIVDDDPLDDGFGWQIGTESFDVSDVEEIRAVMFVGHFASTDLTDGGSFWVDNLLLELFPDEAAMLATPNPNTAPVEGFNGDFNNDGAVDAADYVVWRKGLGTDFIAEDYDAWRANFGMTAGPAAGSLASQHVPEPVSAALALVAVLGIVFRRRLRR